MSKEERNYEIYDREMLGLIHTLCQGLSHGGSYMDKGTFHIRIGLFPVVVSGDYLALLLTPCLPH